MQKKFSASQGPNHSRPKKAGGPSRWGKDRKPGASSQGAPRREGQEGSFARRAEKKGDGYFDRKSKPSGPRREGQDFGKRKPFGSRREGGKEGDSYFERKAKPFGRDAGRPGSRDGARDAGRDTGREGARKAEGSFGKKSSFGGPKKPGSGPAFKKKPSDSRPFGQRRPGRQARPPRNPADFEASNVETLGKEPVRSVIKRAQAVAVPAAPESAMHFSELNLPEEVEKALAAAGFERPTPIQEKSLPHTMNGFDLIGCAQTGTGKTAAFSIPMISRLLEDEDSLALVLAPTRELAIQIQETLRDLTSHAKHIRHGLIIGGASFPEQVRMLRQQPRILVATPGRLVDHLKEKTLSLANVKFLVLDEADRMFDMGFAPQLSKIMAAIPAERQTLLFSATFNKEVRALALKSLKDPKEVFIGATSRPAAGVEQEILETTTEKKFSLLLEELNKREGSVLLFVGMKYRADRLAKSLEEYGHSVTRIHGGRSLGQRKGALRDFKEERVRILVATDVAARGLDIPHVAHVINFDLPKDPEDYIHRIGRTARAGAVGHALSFVTREESDNWKRISRLIAKQG